MARAGPRTSCGVVQTMGSPMGWESSSRQLAVVVPAILGATGLALGLASTINPSLAQVLIGHGNMLLIGTGFLLLACAALTTSLIGLARRGDNLSAILDAVASGVPVADQAGLARGSYPRVAESLLRCLDRIERDAAQHDAALLSNRALAREHRDLGHLLNHLPTGLLMLDRNHRIIFITDPVSPFISSPSGETLGLSIAEVLSNQTLLAWVQREDSEDEDGTTPFSCQIATDGDQRHFLIQRYLSDDPHSGRILLVFSDVSGQRLQEQHEVSVVRTVARLVEGPLRAMESELLRAQPLGEEAVPQHPASNEIHLQIGAVRHLVRNLELLPSLRQGTLTAERATVSVEGLFAEIDRACGRWCAAQNIEFSVTLPGRAISIEGDGRLLATVLNNLVFTAVRHVGAGGRVRVQTSAHEDAFHIEVHDNGPNGAARLREDLARAQEDKSFALDRLERGDIGLTVADGIARIHHGSIELGGPADSGNRYILRLPRTVLQSPGND